MYVTATLLGTRPENGQTGTLANFHSLLLFCSCMEKLWPQSQPSPALQQQYFRHRKKAGLVAKTWWTKVTAWLIILRMQLCNLTYIDFFHQMVPICFWFRTFFQLLISWYNIEALKRLCVHCHEEVLLFGKNRNNWLILPRLLAAIRAIHSSLKGFSKFTKPLFSISRWNTSFISKNERTFFPRIKNDNLADQSSRHNCREWHFVLVLKVLKMSLWI